MSATTIKLSPELRQRVQRLVRGTGKSMHAFMLEAIEQRFEELTHQLSDPAVASSGERFRKVSKERAALALENFFRASNLEQLRELTLRELASQIDAHPQFERGARARFRRSPNAFETHCAR